MDIWSTTRGRFVTTKFLLRYGEDDYQIYIYEGEIKKIIKGPLVTPNWEFSFEAEKESWDKFWSRVTDPKYYDLFSLIKYGFLKINGNNSAFVRNIFFFKSLMRNIGEYLNEN